MTVTEIPLTGLDGGSMSLADYNDRAVLVVNVASKCGLTPQYAALEQLARDYGERGLTVLGVPCNQFMGQEPGTAEEMAEMIAFLASGRASYITGHNHYVSGGQGELS